MAEPRFVFNRRDARILKQVSQERRRNSQARNTVESEEFILPSSGSYIVLLDEDLPPAQFDEETEEVTLGESFGYAYRRENSLDKQWSQLPDEQPVTAVLVPFRDPNSNCVMKRVYNSTGNTYPACSYVECVQDTFGDLYVSSDAFVTELTTTTSFPEFPGSQICLGECKYIWDEPTGVWELDTNNCQTSTTTTTTTTSSTTTGGAETTTTTPACVCGDPKVQNTTTSTTTGVCECTYPIFCGTTDGDCTYTPCSTGDTTPTVECITTTTTTTCDCNTSTTAGPDKVGCCHWVALPNAQGGWFWSLVGNDCANTCICVEPTIAPNCNEAVNDCFIPAPSNGQVPQTCTETCIYWWIPELLRWHLTSSNCGNFSICTCTEPSYAGEDCTPVEVPCQFPNGEAGPDDSCWQCYPTTTSTTTTPGPCDTGCLWQWSGTAWVLESNTCLGDCSCLPPSHDGRAVCEVAHTPCVPATTSTTSTTTTTTSSTTTPACTAWTCSFWCDCPCGDAEWDPAANGGLGGYTCVSDGSSGIVTDRGMPWCAGEAGCDCVPYYNGTPYPLYTPCDDIYGSTGGNASCPPPLSCNQFSGSGGCQDTPDPLTTTTCPPGSTTTTSTTTTTTTTTSTS